MADFRKETQGPDALKGNDVFVVAYDNRVAKDADGKATTHYLDVRLHPDSPRAAGQTSVALVSKRDEKAPGGFNNSARYSASQFEAIVAAAGDNHTPTLDKNGKPVGTTYGVKADLMIKGAKATSEVLINTKTLEASDLVVDATTRDRSFAGMKEAKAAQEAAKAAKAAKAAEAKAPEAETPAVETPAAEKPAAKKRAPRQSKAAREAAAAAAEAAPAEVDEPALG